LYDIHANLPALQAVLDEVSGTDVDEILIGGDVVPGPMPRETVALLQSLTKPVRRLYGNGDLAVLAQVGLNDADATAYWGTPSGAPPPLPVREAIRWTAEQFDPEFSQFLRGWPRTHRAQITGLGEVLFCHGTPRSETECFTRLTPEALLAPVFENLEAPVVVCGHTHMQFDRTVSGVRVVNAGSVGMPFGRTGAHWLILGPTVEFRHTEYDLARAAARIRASEYPLAAVFAEQNVLNAPAEHEMLDRLTGVSFG
jgi:diadenosine tetraphosphatase ApaH/serine/threonine PP2A family protein phosphatase